MALNKGFTAPIVMALGGWKTERMMRRYAAVTHETLRRAAEAVAGNEQWQQSPKLASVKASLTTPRLEVRSRAGGRGHPLPVLDQRGKLLRTSIAVAGLCWVAIFLGACTIANTPQQDLAYARWAKCDSSFPVVLERVDLDGRITFWLSSARSQEVLQCLAEAGRAGPPLPEPLGVCPPKGP